MKTKQVHDCIQADKFSCNYALFNNASKHVLSFLIYLCGGNTKTIFPLFLSIYVVIITRLLT